MSLISRFLWMALLVLAGQLELRAQTVTNVRAAQRAGTKLVDVYYDLSGGSGASTVVVAVSNDGGASYTVPASSLSGAVGSGVNAGLNKHLVWNAGADWNGQFSQAVKFRITATTPPPVPEGFALIPAGSFTMGRTSGDTDSNAPPVSVHVSAFYMAKHEVTKALWDEVRIWGATNGYTDLSAGAGKSANHPVYSISWHDMVKWCNARSEKEALPPCYTVAGAIYKTGSLSAVVCNWSAVSYRLPTEAEWEKAARGGLSGLRFPWGDTISHSQANFSGSSAFTYNVGPTWGDHPSFTAGGTPYTSPVASFAANGYGLYDVVGNVGELCWDVYSNNYYTPGASDPRGPASGSGRVVRDCGWGAGGYTPSTCRVASRASYGSNGRGPYNTGFRVARSFPP